MLITNPIILCNFALPKQVPETLQNQYQLFCFGKKD